MDRLHLEPRNWMHRDLAGLRQLLCAHLLRALPWRPRSSVSARLRPDAVAGAARAAAAVAAAAKDLRELNVRSLPRECAIRVHPPGLRSDAEGRLAHLPGADQASAPHGGHGFRAAVAGTHLGRDECRTGPLYLAGQSLPAPGARSGAVRER